MSRGDDGSDHQLCLSNYPQWSTAPQCPRTAIQKGDLHYLPIGEACDHALVGAVLAAATWSKQLPPLPVHQQRAVIQIFVSLRAGHNLRERLALQDAHLWRKQSLKSISALCQVPSHGTGMQAFDVQIGSKAHANDDVAQKWSNLEHKADIQQCKASDRNRQVFIVT